MHKSAMLLGPLGRLVRATTAVRLVATGRVPYASRVPLLGGLDTSSIRIRTAGTVSAKIERPRHTSEISTNHKLVEINKPDGTKTSYNATWLRQNCQCPVCVHPVAKQRFIQASDLAPTYTLKEASLDGDVLTVTWQEEAHVGQFPVEFLDRYDYSDRARKQQLQARTPPTSRCQGEVTKIPYKTVAGSEKGLWEWVKCLNEDGVCIVSGVPSHVTIEEVVQKIAPMQPTVYGQTFVTKLDLENQINNAYTTKELTLHMDLPYQESPPGYQFLLCERFDSCIEGGESVVVDAWYEADRMKELYPEMFETLTRVPATFHNINYAKDRVDMEYRCPHFVVDKESGEIVYINWTEGMQGPLCVPEEDVEPYFVAYQKFAHMLKHSKSKTEFRLQEGELLGWNNRRFVHGRNGFTANGGSRTFPGCYICIDEMKCRAQLLSNVYNEGRRVKRVFNRSVF